MTVRCILLTAEQATQVRGQSCPGASLEPRLVAASTYVNKYVVNVGVLSDPAHAQHHAFLTGLPQADIDPAKAWPST